METRKLINNIRKFNPGAEHVTLSTIFSKMKVGDKKNRVHVVNHGAPGTGKSFSSIELIEELDLGNDIILDNNTTARGLFEIFQNYPDSDILLDECSKLTSDAGSVDTLKLAMEGKQPKWTKKGSTETAPEYKGNLIINVNHPLPHDLTDRCFVNKTLMNKKMALDFVDYYMSYFRGEQIVDDSFIPFLKRRITDEKTIPLTEKELEYVIRFTKDRIKLIDERLGYSRRIIQRMISYFSRTKKLFGSMNNEVLEFIEPFATIYIENNKTPTILERLVGDEKIDKTELIKLLAKEGGYSIRHARRLVNKEIEENKLKTYGRKVYYEY